MLCQLRLHTDSLRLLRCLTRLENAALPYDSRHPILLPRKTSYVRLLILKTHAELHHAGVSHTLSQLQLQYWICHGRATVRRVLATCVTCKRHEGSAFRLPPMPPFPKERVVQCQPFQHSGLDSLGPLLVKDGDSTLKVSICLFTCLSVRAVHLELARGLSSQQFLNCLRRFFVARPVVHVASFVTTHLNSS